MEKLCNICYGSAAQFSANLGSMARRCQCCEKQALTGAMTCSDFDVVGTVLDSNQQDGWVVLRLHEALHKGDELLALAGSLSVQFRLGTMYASGMSLALALAGWEIKVITPAALPAGTKILRAA